ncbi:hypothetical protein ACLOJK_019259 [Asimina triloba]
MSGPMGCLSFKNTRPPNCFWIAGISWTGSLKVVAEKLGGKCTGSQEVRMGFGDERPDVVVLYC